MGGLTQAAGRQSPDVEQAIAMLLEEFRENEWFTRNHWAVNEPHVRQMIADVSTHYRPDDNVHLLDIGCFNGYVSFLFAQLGYKVTGTDAADYADRRALFEKSGIGFFRSNLNDLVPFKQVADASFDVVILAQVIEHVLNHPLGLLRDIARVLRPGGLLILTTPNPATLMNAARVVLGRASLWGTRDFIDLPKIDESQIITRGEIHYREYLSSEMCYLLDAAGFQIERVRYLGLGTSRDQPFFKRIFKQSPLSRWLMSMRLFASNHYFVAVDEPSPTSPSIRIPTA